MNIYTLGVRITGDMASYQRAMRAGLDATRGFAAGARRELERLNQFMRSTQGQLASLGAGVGLVQLQRNAAQLEKTLIQVRLTAGMTAREQTEAYQELFRLVKRDGGALENMVGGFNNLIQAGLSYREALASSDAMSMGQAVTGARPEILAGGLTVGAANFSKDLAQVGVATEMLDKMTVAGRLGNAELENLSDIFSRVAQRAQSANFSFDKTLAFIEGLSLIERQPERLATLADSTLRLFTNANYAKDAEKATGVRFFDRSGTRRDPIAVLEELRKKYQALSTDAQRFNFMSSAFGQADLDTQRGLQALFGGNQLELIREYEERIKTAGGTLAKDLPEATRNAADQASRLKNTLREAAEAFARPVNDAIANAVRQLLDSKEQGGLGVTGGQLLAGGAGALLGGYAAYRVLPGMASKLLGRLGGVGAGVAAGKALEAAAGILPVYVTNWAEFGQATGIAGLPGKSGTPAPGTILDKWGRPIPSAGSAAPEAAKAVGTAASLLPLGGAVLGTAGAAAAVGAPILLGGAELYDRMTGTESGLRERIADREKRLAEYDQLLQLQRTGEDTAQAIARTQAQRDQMAASRDDMVQRLNQVLAEAKIGGEITLRVQAAPGLSVDTDVKPSPGTRIKSDLGRVRPATGE